MRATLILELAIWLATSRVEARIAYSRPTVTSDWPALITAPPSFGHMVERRQSVGTETCGYIDGEFADPLVCRSGQCTFSDINGTSYYGCCEAGQMDSCSVWTSCVDQQHVISTDTNPQMLTCPPAFPSCQTYTWPDVTAVGYSCATAGGTVTVHRTPTSTTTGGSACGTGREACGDGCMPADQVCCETYYCEEGSVCLGDLECSAGSSSSRTTSSRVSTRDTSQSETVSTGDATSSPTNGPSGNGPIYGLTKPQRIGIGVGIGSMTVMFAAGVIYCLRRGRDRKDTMPAALDGPSQTEKSIPATAQQIQASG